MGAPLAARPTCACCASPMDEVETVAVLASLQGHTVYECEWCHHITLVAERTAPADGARWPHHSIAGFGISYAIAL
jgi:hypothetical protein